jgi:hypothetical protein
MLMNVNGAGGHLGKLSKEPVFRALNCIAGINSHCNHPVPGRERDCAAALMWKSTELMYDSIRRRDG